MTLLSNEIRAAREISIMDEVDDRVGGNEDIDSDADDIQIDNDREYISLRKSRAALDHDIAQVMMQRDVVSYHGGRTLCNEVSKASNGVRHVVPPISYESITTANSATAVTQTELLSRNARTAARLIREGEIRRAINALRSPGMANPIDENDPIIQQLRNLNPTSYASAPRIDHTNAQLSTNYLFSRPLLPPAVPVIMDIGALKQSFLNVNNGSAPGLSGLTGEMSAWLARDADCMQVLYDIATDCFANRVPPNMSQLMRSSLMLAGYKNVNQDSVRPIAIGDVILKSLDDFNTNIIAMPISKNTLQPSQLAIGVAGGSEVALHLLQIQLEASSGKDVLFEDLPAILKLDIRNAFSTADRAAFFHAIRSDPDANKTAAFAQFLYGTPSKLVIRMKNGEVSVIVSEEGFHQGRKSSSVYFCLMISIGLNAILKKYPTVKAVGIVDDIHLIGDLSRLNLVFNEFKLYIESELSMSLNVKKCHILWAHSQAAFAPVLLRDMVMQNGFVLDVGVMETLGGIVGLPMWVPRSAQPQLQQSISQSQSQQQQQQQQQQQSHPQSQLQSQQQHVVSESLLVQKFNALQVKSNNVAAISIAAAAAGNGSKEVLKSDQNHAMDHDHVSAVDVGVSIAVELVGANSRDDMELDDSMMPTRAISSQPQLSSFGVVDGSGISGLSYRELTNQHGHSDCSKYCDVFDARVSATRKIFTDMEVIFQNLLHPKITHQMLLIVLRQSIATQTNYALRTTPSNLAYEPMKHYNESLLTCLGQKLNLPSVTQLQRAQISIRISKSGLGMRCLAEAQIPISYVCSFIQAIPLCHDILSQSRAANNGELACVGEFMRNVGWIRRNAFRTISNAVERQNAIDKLLPATFAACLVKFRYAAAKHLQHALSLSFENALFAAMIHDTETSMADRARLLDLTSRFASGWIQTTPSHQQLTLTDDAVDVAVRSRIGCEAVECDHNLLRCPRCQFLYALDSWHPLWCPKNKKCGLNDRHDEGRNRIVEVAISNGQTAHSEPNVYGDGESNPGARPDLIVNLLKKSIVGDLTYRYINSPSYLSNGNALIPGRVLRYAENSKISKHKQRAATAGLDFYPMVMSTYGAMAPQLIRLFMEMSEEESTRLSHSPMPLLVAKSSHDQHANRQMLLNAQQYPISPLEMDLAPDPPPNLNLGLSPSVAASDRRAKLVAGAKASEAIDMMSPEPSMFWELVRVLAISTQRENARLVLNDLRAARIFVRDLNHNTVVPHI